MTPSISGGSSWTVGTYTTELLDVSLLAFPNTVNNVWGIVNWTELQTDDSSEAYVEVDILNSDGTVNFSNVPVESNNQLKSFDLNDYDVRNKDCYLKFKLYGLTKSPIIKNLKISGRDTW